MVEIKKDLQEVSLEDEYSAMLETQGEEATSPNISISAIGF